MSFLEDNKNMVERRSGKDRRENKPPILSIYWLTGKRGLPRRKQDRNGHQLIDRYSSKILVIIMVILSLSILDAILTLILVNSGAHELNPLMAYYLDISPSLFICMKYLLTSASVMIILLYKDHRLFRTNVKVKILFYLLPIPFIIVIPWQLSLILFNFKG
jgi:hypothetical protein